MKIICAGVWKTGTKSLTKSLRDFGYTVYDFEEQFLYLDQLWKAFLDGSVTDEHIYEALKDIDVLIDGPTIVFWEEIFRVFPDAKVILTRRSTDEEWWNSYKKAMGEVRNSRYLYYASMLTPLGRRITLSAARTFRLAWGIDKDLYSNPDAHKRLYLMKYRMHNAHVIHTVPSNQLLVHVSRDGWSKLCKFLDKEVPDKPYPHQNKNSSILKEGENQSAMIAQLIKEMKIYGVIYSATIATAIYFAYSYFKKDSL